MIVITGTIRMIDSAEADRVQAALAARVRRSREDAGCIDYAFARSVDDPAEFRLIEKWASDEDLRAHLDVPDPEFTALLGEARIESAVVARATTGEETEMMRR